MAIEDYTILTPLLQNTGITGDPQAQINQILGTLADTPALAALLAKPDITQFIVQKVMQCIPLTDYHPNFTKNDLEKVLMNTIPTIAKSDPFPKEALSDMLICIIKPHTSTASDPHATSINGLKTPEDFSTITHALLSLPSTTIESALTSLGATRSEAIEIAKDLQSDALKTHLSALIASSAHQILAGVNPIKSEDEATIEDKQQAFLTHCSAKTLRFVLKRFSPSLEFILDEQDIAVIKKTHSGLLPLLKHYKQKRYTYVLWSLSILSFKVLVNKLKRQTLLALSVAIALIIILPIIGNIIGIIGTNIPDIKHYRTNKPLAYFNK